MLYQLSYAPEKVPTVSPERFERPTYGFEVRCSIQLSYGPALRRVSNYPRLESVSRWLGTLVFVGPITGPGLNQLR